MSKYIPYLIYLWLIALHNVFLADLTSIFGIKINLTILIILLVTVFKAEIDILWFSFVAALVAYAGMNEMLAIYILLTTGLAITAYHLKERMNLEATPAKLLFVLSGVVIHNIILLILSGLDNFFILLVKQGLLGSVYTSIIAWVFFMAKEKRITFRKLRSIF